MTSIKRLVTYSQYFKYYHLMCMFQYSYSTGGNCSFTRLVINWWSINCLFLSTLGGQKRAKFCGRTTIVKTNLDLSHQKCNFFSHLNLLHLLTNNIDNRENSGSVLKNKLFWSERRDSIDSDVIFKLFFCKAKLT